MNHPDFDVSSISSKVRQTQSYAMAFVPTQEFDTPYDPVLAFSRGTIFPALDKPFLGEEAVPQ